MKFLSITYYIGMALVLIGTLAAVSNVAWAGFLLAFGVAPIIAVRFYNRWVCSLERQRINGILLVSSLVMACAVVAYFMGHRAWIVCLFIAAVLDGYSSFRRIA